MASRPYVIAHRGTSSRYPENTLPAFQNALEVGADWIEIDVVTSADDVLVVSHDTSVDRCTDGTGKIGTMTLEQIQQLDAGVRRGPEFAGVRIPTLAATLDFLAGGPVRLCVEIKGDTPDETLATARATVEMLQRRDWLQRTVITSFEGDCLRAIKTWEPLLATARDPDRQDGTYTPWQLCQQVLGCHANFLLHRHNTLTPDIVAEAHMHGFSLWTWTVNTPDEARRVMTMDVDGIMTDQPDMLRQVVDSTKVIPQAAPGRS